MLQRLGDMIDQALLHAAERRERDRLACAGETLAASLERDATAARDQLPKMLIELRLRIGAISDEIPRSLEADRADYAGVSGGLRGIVILRGLCTRAILRNRRARVRRELRPFYEALGRSAMAAQREPDAAPVAPATRARSALPQSNRLGTEVALFAKAFKKQLRDRLFPRLPGLMGLAAGWWVANTYTDSHWKSALRSVGIGDGGTHVVSGETYRIMMLSLPILSAAVCAYLGDRLAHFVRQRYATHTVPQPSHPGSPPPAASESPVDGFTVP